ncbi:MAG: aldehyde dehydrogenase [Thermoanaerobaculia bacterium]|jgi:aldehyde dehydrogenase (NAD+)|nr:aldehyde dehydrogenase [Thermoanaerobaculia bacterium]
MVSIDPRFVRVSASDEIARVYTKQRAHYEAEGATTASQRIEKLRRLHDAIFARRDDIYAALWADYEKPPSEIDLSEIYPVVSEARHAIRHLRRWMRPRRVATPLALFGSRSRIVHEPKGVVLIISPWNFPLNLTLGPLISAIAAGNCVVIKPSEMTQHTSACMKKILRDLFDENEVAVIEGDAEVAEELLAKKWDHIFFTGSPAVGRVVMRAAAEHLTPVTLELGGKSPVIVDRTANLDEAAKKIAWGKFFNSGQICIAPDYLLVDEAIREPFIEKLRAAMTPETGLIVNDRHAARVKRLFDDAVAGGAEVVAGGRFNARAIGPALLANVDPESPLMQQEIFGPLLPMLTYRTIDDAIRVIAEREKPLVLYLFSRSRKVIREVMSRTSAGGTAINDTLLHFFQLNLPFGGVGESGMGRAHGRFGFETFSNVRGVFEQPTRFSAMQLLYPPYSKFKKRLIDLTIRYF